jgi:hypothetical protein
MFFLLFLLADRRIRIPIRISDYWIRMMIWEAQKQMDPMDPDPDADPQHCFLGFLFLLFKFLLKTTAPLLY